MDKCICCPNTHISKICKPNMITWNTCTEKLRYVVAVIINAPIDYIISIGIKFDNSFATDRKISSLLVDDKNKFHIMNLFRISQYEFDCVVGIMYQKELIKNISHV